MAKTEEKKVAASAAGSEFNWGQFRQFMPEGLDAKDFEKTGGLAPIYAPKAAHEGNFPPLVGYMIRTQLLPEVQQGKQVFIPEMILVEALAPTKAVIGNRREGQEEVDVKPGDLVVVPITGNLQVNEVLLAAADDPKEVHVCGLRVAGTRQVNDMPSPMWVWDMMLHPKALPRKGSHENLLRSNERPRLPNGEKYTRDGEIKQIGASA